MRSNGPLFLFRKALKYFPDPHDGTGCVTVAFTGADHILASVGSEPAGKQTICLWDFGPSSLGKSPIGYDDFFKTINSPSRE